MNIGRDQQVEGKTGGPAIRAKLLLGWLLAAAILLSVLYVVSYRAMKDHSNLVLMNFAEMVDVNGEGNVPAWFSASLWSLSGYLAFLVALGRKARGEKWGDWVALGALFLLLSMDEAAQLHENIGYFIQLFMHGSGFFSWLWVIYGFILIALGLLMFLRLIRSLTRFQSLLFAAAATLFVAGALGLEMYGAAISDKTVTFAPGLNWPLIIAMEEFLEMLGVIVNLAAVLNVLAGHDTQLRVRW